MKVMLFTTVKEMFLCYTVMNQYLQRVWYNNSNDACPVQRSALRRKVRHESASHMEPHGATEN